jgi:hypothetical protein
MSLMPPNVIEREVCLQVKGHYEIMKICSKVKVSGKKRQGKCLIKSPR